MSKRSTKPRQIESSSIYTIELSSYESPKVTEGKGNKGWVEYGENNSYYQHLIDTYNNSSTHHSIVNSISKLIYGQGLDATDSSRNPSGYAQMKLLFKPDVLRKAIKDYKLLGQFALQVIYNKAGDKIVKVEHLPINLVRAGKCNEYGIIDTYYYSDNWANTKKFHPKTIPAFGYGDNKLELMVVGNYTVGQKYYSNVDYLGAIPYAIFEAKIATYLINEVDNSFSPTTIVTFLNGVPPREEQELIVNKLQQTSTGVNGKKFMVGFGDGQETKPAVDKITLDGAADIYEYLSTESRDKLLLGHGVTSGLLFGIPTATGFSSNADELKNASILFDNMVIRPFQEVVTDALETILAFNGVALNLYFKTLQPLEFIDLSGAKVDKETREEETGVKLSEQSPLDGYGEVLDLNEWELVSTSSVDYNTEEQLDKELEELNNPKLSLKDKVVNLAKTGTARTRAKSKMDGEQFISRYRYAGNPNPEREFCRLMMNAGKLYRKEDIDRMSRDAKTNPNFGLGGSDTYDIFLWKGGGKMSEEFPNGTCKHYWVRETYRRSGRGSQIDYDNEITPSQARKAGEILPTVDKRAYQAPHDMK